MGGVSVIIPTYNRASFLRRSVRSVLEQSYTDLEIVIVDGGSTDGTRDVIEAFDDDRLRIHYRKRPQGLSSARNKAMELATGEYIAFLDDDDRLAPSAIETLVDALVDRPEGCAGAFGGWLTVRNGGETAIRSVPTGTISFEDIRERNVIGGPSGTLFRTSVFETVGTFDESLPAREDVDMWMRILDRYTMVGIDEVLYERSMHDDQLVDDPEKMLYGHEQIIDRYGESMTDAHRMMRHRWAVKDYVKLGRSAEARREYRRALSIDPEERDWYYYAWLHLGTPGYAIGKRFHESVYNRFVYDDAEAETEIERSTRPAPLRYLRRLREAM